MSQIYAAIGVAGYIAPRHLKAIKDTGGELVAAYDINDSVGILDQYFPETNFCTEFESFYAFLDDLRQSAKPVNYVSICSPNHLHKPHIHSALRLGSDAICEKPLVLNPADLDDLHILEHDTNRRVAAILQLRLHPAIIALKKRIEADESDRIYDVDLSYFTSRGQWYHQSWKGEPQKSGGIAANIGVHFFDMLAFLFGMPTSNILHHCTGETAAGYLEFKRARVRWILSIDRQHLPDSTPAGQTTYRSIRIEGEEIEFSGGFTDLHTLSYEHILAGKGFGLEDVRASIEIVDELRSALPAPNRGEQHPYLSSIRRM
jgi:UDP-N-acetyl-2-amino-2-deoxyglucuronate dehydrogenase